ncbi:IspD/TarI family cytidylyltransferase [uncultured Treponema sp.]|uniref:IspD/TarI family cytidylyltransferase n=1 Tax=uncultured Treponema sp. TaxID=162155 RepID=UPI0025D0D3C0|nr:IspD/TarI family cytidylyltransferase [uncultured Treponema sp.]
MNLINKHLIVLSGGVGSRMRSDTPKQYLKVCDKPILYYTLKSFDFNLFNKIIIVVADEWKEFVEGICKNAFSEQEILFAPAGKSRQESILHGLNVLKNYALTDDLVVIHDAARACCSRELVQNLIEACENYDGAMPVLSVKDTVYLSETGHEITGLLERDKLFCGQAPEAFKYGRYLAINEKLTSEELGRVRGSSEIAFRNGMKIAFISGDEANFKITTPADLERFEEIQKRKETK